MIARTLVIAAIGFALAACSPGMNGGQGFKNADGKYGAGPSVAKNLGSTAICDSPDTSGATANCKDLNQN